MGFSLALWGRAAAGRVASAGTLRRPCIIIPAYNEEETIRAVVKKVRAAEVPISYHPRSYAGGKKITWRPGVRMRWTILKWRVRSF